MPDETFKKDDPVGSDVTRNGLDCTTIDSELGIDTITFKCTSELARQLRSLAENVDMQLEPFVRQTLAEHVRTKDVSNRSDVSCTSDVSDSAGQAGSEVTEARSQTFDWGHCRRLSPVNRDFGFATGQPIDRYYIEQFLGANERAIKGRVLEVADATYTRRFGGDRVTASDILHVQKNETATVVGDLSTGEGIPLDTFDCIILTQTLPFIFNFRQAIDTCWKALRNGGVILCTVNGISQISRYDMERWGDYWRFTDLSVTKLLCNNFAQSEVSVVTFGNTLSAVAFLLGLPAQDLRMSELDFVDPDYQVLVGAKAVKQS